RLFLFVCRFARGGTPVRISSTRCQSAFPSMMESDMTARVVPERQQRGERFVIADRLRNAFAGLKRSEGLSRCIDPARVFALDVLSALVVCEHRACCKESRRYYRLLKRD